MLYIYIAKEWSSQLIVIAIDETFKFKEIYKLSLHYFHNYNISNDYKNDYSLSF